MPVLTIGIVSPKGGSGKTTTAVHLTRFIQKTGNEVLILDTDPQASALAWQSKQPEGYHVPVVHADTDDVQGALREVEGDADVVVIDGAAKIEPRTGRIVKASDVAIIPAQPTPLDSWGLEQVVNTVLQSETPGAILITQQKPGTKMARDIEEGLSESYDLPILNSRLSHRVAFEEGMFDGRTALDVSPHEISGADKAQEEVEALVAELKKFIQNHV